MNDQIRSVIVRAPITLKIGPVPDTVDGHAGVATFGLANVVGIVKNALQKSGIAAEVDGERAIVSYVDEGTLTSFTMGGKKLDDRHYRIQPAGDEHALEFSEDRGVTFERKGTLADYDLARAFGDAWVDGRAEKSA